MRMMLVVMKSATENAMNEGIINKSLPFLFWRMRLLAACMLTWSTDTSLCEL